MRTLGLISIVGLLAITGCGENGDEIPTLAGPATGANIIDCLDESTAEPVKGGPLSDGEVVIEGQLGDSSDGKFTVFVFGSPGDAGVFKSTFDQLSDGSDTVRLSSTSNVAYSYSSDLDSDQREILESCTNETEDVAVDKNSSSGANASAEGEVTDTRPAPTGDSETTEPGVQVPPGTASCEPGFTVVGNEESEMCVPE